MSDYLEAGKRFLESAETSIYNNDIMDGHIRNYMMTICSAIANLIRYCEEQEHNKETLEKE